MYGNFYAEVVFLSFFSCLSVNEAGVLDNQTK